MSATSTSLKHEALEKEKKAASEQFRSIVGELDKYIYTSLFHKVYILNDFKIAHPEHWDGKKGSFSNFFDGFYSICQSVSATEAKSWSHADTLKNWILPIVHLLGWSGIEGSEDDCCVQSKTMHFIDEAGNDCVVKPPLVIGEDSRGKNRINSAKTDKAYAEVRNHALLTITTGYYGSWAEKRSGKYDQKRDELPKFGDVYSNYSPNEKASYYLQAFGHNWAIATDGYTWRLFNREFAYSNNTYFEFKLGRLFDDMRTSKVDKEDEALIDSLKYFFWTFSKDGLFGKPLSIANIALSKSKNYFSDLEDDLKGRFVHAMTIAVNGIYDRHKEISKKEISLDLVRDTAESLIFSLLFIRSCESRRVISLNQSYLKVALATLIKKIRDYDSTESANSNFERLNFGLSNLFGKSIKPKGFEVFNYICNLKEILQDGTGAKYDFGFKIDGFKETVFSGPELSLLQKTKLDNETLIKLLFEMFYEYAEGRVQEMPFESFTPRNLGSIFESFLEFKVEPVSQKYVHLKKSVKGKIKWQWKPLSKIKKSEESHVTYTINRGQLRFSPCNEDKKDAGAFYTPEYIVQYMVRETLGPLIKGKTSEEISSIRVCDPAMGSGHFLVAALKYLTKHYVSASSNSGEIFQSRSTTKWKILDSCIFGIDMNPRAVKLTKLSLWLETADSNRKLEKLEDQIIEGNSLTGKGVFGADGKRKFKQPFDAIIGNPPYGANIEKNDVPLVEDFFSSRYEDEIGIDNFSKVDTFALFVLSSLKTITPNGRVGLLLSDTLRTIRSFEKIREYLLVNRAVNKVDLMPKDAFSPVIVNTCFVALTGAQNRSESIQSKNFEDIVSEQFEEKESKIESHNHSVADLLRISNKPLLSDIHSDIRDLIVTNPATLGLGDPVLVGSYAGLQTGNDPKYVAILEGANLDGLNIKTGIDSLQQITRDQICTRKLSEVEKINGISKAGPKFVPFIKATRAARYFYESPLYIDWSVESVRRIATAKNKKGAIAGVLRNRDKYFMDCIVSDGTEGVLSTYFVKNSIPAVSTNIILSETNEFSTKYLCGLLNSSLMSYIISNCINASLKGMSSHVTPMDIARLPYKRPSRKQIMEVEKLVDQLVPEFKIDSNIVTNRAQAQLDQIIFDVYNVPSSARSAVSAWFIDRRTRGVLGQAKHADGGGVDRAG